MILVKDVPLNRLTGRGQDTVEAALELMEAADQPALGVTEGDQLIGVLTLEGAVLSDSASQVKDAMRSVELAVQMSDQVRHVAKQFVVHKADYATVWDGKKYVGLITANSLLGVLGNSYDPLTGLSWSDRLREWGLEMLTAGKEVCIVFFDLDRFGDFNKQYGHVVGDRVISTFAKMLESSVDIDNDLLVRYGGDEFVVGSTRSRIEVEEWLRELREIMLAVPGVEEPILFTIGIAGGMRAQGRNLEHTAAMLDNLINLASKDCIQRKRRREAGDPSSESGVRSLAIGAVAPYEVQIETIVHGRVGVAKHADTQRSQMEVVGDAVALALMNSHPHLKINVDDSMIHLDDEGGKVLTVVGRCSLDSETVLISATRELGEDVYLTMAEAVLDAFLTLDPEWVTSGFGVGAQYLS